MGAGPVGEGGGAATGAVAAVRARGGAPRRRGADHRWRHGPGRPAAVPVAGPGPDRADRGAGPRVRRAAGSPPRGRARQGGARGAPAVRARAPGRAAGHRVELRGVRFGYDDREVLRGVDLVLEPGTVTALVGPSGSGKSTVVKLLPRFFDPSAGSVTLGGVDLRDLAERDLHRMVSFVFQDVRLLRASVADNIALAVPDADFGDVVRAARRAGIHDRVLELPHGYDTVIGEETGLSGGEAQRVALARALLADAPVLVLDEATAFADPQTELAVRRALTTLGPDRTVLVIAHRMETVADADAVAVLADGVVVEHGPPSELLARDGAFAGFWRSAVAR
ncbi:ATP-binding cassette domain-containing protein [Actinokineospora soli]|uniref:ATP-binding cassette domain-containing protein n=1 Tax=Actinokineospora soli TaxID=1048753 RepID=A0ABW2TN35_9PSEU